MVPRVPSHPRIEKDPLAASQTGSSGPAYKPQEMGSEVPEEAAGSQTALQCEGIGLHIQAQAHPY
jgi:hypothetical protein